MRRSPTRRFLCAAHWSFDPQRVRSSYLPLCNTHWRLARRLGPPLSRPRRMRAHKGGYSRVASADTMERRSLPHKAAARVQLWQESVNMAVWAFQCVPSVTKGFQSHNEACACVVINAGTKEVCRSLVISSLETHRPACSFSSVKRKK